MIGHLGHEWVIEIDQGLDLLFKVAYILPALGRINALSY